MQLVEPERAEALYAAMPPGTETSGGSAANTAVGVAALGGSAAFIGKVRDDQLGAVYAHDIRAAGVDFAVAPAPEGPPTARSLIVVTPDAHRTMSTSLGIAGEVDTDDIDVDLVASAAVVYCEGYLWDREPTKDAIRLVMRVAREAGNKVALVAVRRLLRRASPVRVPRARPIVGRRPVRQRRRDPIAVRGRALRRRVAARPTGLRLVLLDEGRCGRGRRARRRCPRRRRPPSRAGGRHHRRRRPVRRRCPPRPEPGS